MNATDLVAELESRYPCVQGLHRARCQTGEPYVVIGAEWRRLGEEHRPKGEHIPGTVRECVRSISYGDEDTACQQTLVAFNAYEAHWRTQPQPDVPPVLYWRYDTPHAFWYGDDEGPKGERGRLKVRLVLSALQVVEISDDEYDAQRRAELADQILTGDHHGQQER